MPAYLHIFLLFIAWVAIAVGCHMRIKHYFLASFVAAITMALVTQISGYIELGHMDPLWIIGTITSFFMGSLVALVVGLPFRLVRNLDKNKTE